MEARELEVVHRTEGRRLVEVVHPAVVRRKKAGRREAGRRSAAGREIVRNDFRRLIAALGPGA
jgi:hypothetical protein